MSSSLEAKSALHFGVARDAPSPRRDTGSSNLDQQNTAICEPKSSSATSMRPKPIYVVGGLGKVLLVVCFTACLVSMISYDSSHSRPASQGIFSTVCLPIVSRLNTATNERQVTVSSSENANKDRKNKN